LRPLARAWEPGLLEKIDLQLGCRDAPVGRPKVGAQISARTALKLPKQRPKLCLRCTKIFLTTRAVNCMYCRGDLCQHASPLQL
jgi:hypothetical protein